jgi:3,4-dihydroxy 2-butanone 4-phosphate synthase/GTP cyclohydrolase II
VIKHLVKTRLPTGFGDFSLHLYVEDGKEHLALVKGDVAQAGPVPVRVHSECLTGDVFGSRRCDCGDQLKHALMYLGRQEAGVLVYLRQEGRGIGLLKKMEAYNLQDQGLDTVEANIQLGHQPDERDYGIGARILRGLGVKSIRLMTNNPQKIEALEAQDIVVTSRIPIEVGHHEENLEYLRSKASRMAHLLRFREQIPDEQHFAFLEPLADHLAMAAHEKNVRPFVTLYAIQSLDGRLMGSGQEGDALAEYLQRHHDAVMVGAATLVESMSTLGEALQVVWDPALTLAEAMPASIRVDRLVILTLPEHDPMRRQSLESRGIRLLVVPQHQDGVSNLHQTLGVLASEGVRSVLVRGDDPLISACLYGQLVDYAVFRLVPSFRGGVSNTLEAGSTLPQFAESHVHLLGRDVVAFGPLSHPSLC